MDSDTESSTAHSDWRPTDTLGARLILMRRQLGLNQREAAERSGIPFGQWQGLEDDERQPRGLIGKIQRIADTFGVDRDWLAWGGPLSSGHRGSRGTSGQQSSDPTGHYPLIPVQRRAAGPVRAA